MTKKATWLEARRFFHESEFSSLNIKGNYIWKKSIAFFDSNWLPWSEIPSAFALGRENMPFTKSLPVSFNFSESSKLDRIVNLPARAVDSSLISKRAASWVRANIDRLIGEIPGLIDGPEGEYSAGEFPSVFLTGGSNKSTSRVEEASLAEVMSEIKEVVNQEFGTKSWGKFTKLLWKIELLKSINEFSVFPVKVAPVVSSEADEVPGSFEGIHGFCAAFLGKRSTGKGFALKVKRELGLARVEIERWLGQPQDGDLKTLYQKVFRKEQLVLDVGKGEFALMLYFSITREGEIAFMPFFPSEMQKMGCRTCLTFDESVFSALVPPVLVRMNDQGLPEYLCL